VALDLRATKGEALDGWIADRPTAAPVRQPCERFAAMDRRGRVSRSAGQQAAERSLRWRSLGSRWFPKMAEAYAAPPHCRAQFLGSHAQVARNGLCTAH